MIQKLHFMGKWVRLLLLIAATAAVVSVAYREFRYRNRFGHFPSYGIQADFRHVNNQLGIPGVRTSYCLMVTNFTVLPTTFEVIRLPGGIVGTGLEPRFRIEKWRERTREWLILVDSAAPDRSGLDHPNSVVRLWPGQSFCPAGCYALAPMDGFRKAVSS